MKCIIIFVRFVMVLFISALQQIDPALYESASIDGGNSWDCFLHVSLTGIAPTLILQTCKPRFTDSVPIKKRQVHGLQRWDDNYKRMIKKCRQYKKQTNQSSCAVFSSLFHVTSSL